MHAIVTAGGIPQPGEPLYEYTQGENKALLDVAGKPMIQWVLDALCGAETVSDICIIGLLEDSGLVCSKPVTYVPNQGELVANIRAGVRKVLESQPDASHVLVVSSDIPGITPAMVDWAVKAAMQTDDDLYYNVITRQVMEKRFPTSKRSFTRLKDVEVCGGDMNIISTRLVAGREDFWNRLVAARKNVFKQAALIGYDTLFLLLLRRISLDAAVATVAKRLNISGRAILCPYAEIGMDIDKPHQLEIMRADLAQHQPA